MRIGGYIVKANFAVEFRVANKPEDLENVTRPFFSEYLDRIFGEEN